MSESGRDAAPEVVSLGDGRYVLVSGNSRQLAFAARRGHETWVFIDGRVEVVHAAAGRRAARVHDDGGLMAPMPATVVRIDAAAGTRVSAGDVVITLEAMKMELPLRAAGDGVVKAVHCREGELVQADTVLVELA